MRASLAGGEQRTKRHASLHRQDRHLDRKVKKIVLHPARWRQRDGPPVQFLSRLHVAAVSAGNQ
jgi:hypothetical protein